MSEQKWYEALYEGFDSYDEEPYTQGTEAEVDFVEAQIAAQLAAQLAAQMAAEAGGKRATGDRVRILDVGCGTGRHSRELARRGYAVVGVDLSESMLAQARERAAAEGVVVTFRREDARALPFKEEFDIAIMLCEGGFSLVETDEMDRQIVKGIARALRPGGLLVMTAPNAALMLAQEPDEVDFDAVTQRERFTLESADGEVLECSQRYYTVPELKSLLQEEGLEEVSFFAITGDGYEAGRAPGKEDFELGVMGIRSVGLGNAHG